AAELDPKRGPTNALGIIERAIAEAPSNARSRRVLGLRRAAIALRRIFLERRQFPEPMRYTQALATFSQLDLTEPGLAEWLTRSLEHNPTARARLGPSSKKNLTAALLLRGQALNRKRVVKIFTDAFERAGFSLRFVSAKKAAFVLKLSSQGVKSPRPGQSAVRTELGIEHIIDKKADWQTQLFRTTSADTPKAALESGVQWLARIGGRDLLFRWLSTQGLPTLSGNERRGLRNHSHAH
ncbi:MAG: hypothetical protein AAF449_19745, partial [Myxococcota bacterium]